MNNHFKPVFLFLLFTMILVLLVSACSPAVFYVTIQSAAGFEQEKEFLISVIEENEDIAALGIKLQPEIAKDGRHKRKTASYITLEIISFWENENRQDDTIIISKKYLAPVDNPISSRTDTSLIACLDGNEKLMPINEIDSPYTALRADNLAVDDDNYPLVLLSGIRIKPAKRIINKQLKEKIVLLKEILKKVSKPLINPAPELLWITCGGDFMLDTDGVTIFLRDGPHAVLGSTADLIASSDLALINMEGVISRRGTEVEKSFNFRFAPGIAPALREAGIDAVLHANNHVFDYGMTAFLDSLFYLVR